MTEKSEIEVFCITDFWYPKIGGMERSIENLCSSFPKNIKMHVVTCQPDGDPINKRFPFNVSYFPTNGADGYYSAVLKFIQSNWKPKVLHVFGFSYLWPQAQAAFIRSAAQTRHTGIVMKIPTLGDAKNYLNTTFSCAKNAVHRFVALSNAIREELLDCGIPRENIMPVSNGVRTQLFKPCSSQTKLQSRLALGLPEKRILLGFAGRFEKRKRLDILVSAVRQFPADQRPCLVLAGYADNTFGTGSDISGLIDEDIKWLPPQQDIRPFYHALDIYVSASEAEGMSNAILEAMACGLPAIASDIPGHREMIDHGRNGLLFPAGRPDKLSHGIAEVMNKISCGEIAAWQTAARKTIERTYAQQDITKQYETMYMGLIKNIVSQSK